MGVAACVEDENDTRWEWWSYHCLGPSDHESFLDY